MEKEIEDLKAYLQGVSSFAFPKYKELPGVELYMEQVLKYINGTLDSLTLGQEKMLTSFMANNYVKAKMIDPPVKKRYTKDQIGYLMAICLMKSTISMADMSLLLELDSHVSADKGRLYAFWADMENSILSETAEKSFRRVDSISRFYDENKTKDKAKAEDDTRARLGLIALRLAIQAQANKLISDSIIAALRQDMHGEAGVKDAEEKDKPTHHQERAQKKEAKRLGAEKKEKESKKESHKETEKKKPSPKKERKKAK